MTFEKLKTEQPAGGLESTVLSGLRGHALCIYVGGKNAATELSRTLTGLESCCITSLTLVFLTWLSFNLDFGLTPFKIAVSNPLLDASTCLDTACICQETKSQPCWVVVHQASLITFLHFKGKQNLLQSFLRFRNGWIQKNWLEKFIKIKYAMHSLETARPSVLRS